MNADEMDNALAKMLRSDYLKHGENDNLIDFLKQGIKDQRMKEAVQELKEVITNSL